VSGIGLLACSGMLASPSGAEVLMREPLPLVAAL
jgi:hypothetical protein